MTDKHQRINAYQSSYLDDYDFEKVMVWARQKYIIFLIEETKPEVVVEIGCGFDQLFEKIKDIPYIKRWIIVEPASAFASRARELFSADSRVSIIERFIEDAVMNWHGLPKADLCICSGLLHEIKTPYEVVRSGMSVLIDNGLFHVNVPNAYSFHRRLAYEMGIIDSLHEMSGRNKSLFQYHVFDKESLKALVKKSGLTIEEEGGYFIKPFTHRQMIKMLEVIGDDVIEGLWNMGRKHPEFASEIYINARRLTA